MVRSSRSFTSNDAPALVDQLRSSHQTVVAWLAKVPINSPVYAALNDLNAALARAAEAAGGDLRTVGHKTPG
jgi:hypothetical protein